MSTFYITVAHFVTYSISLVGKGSCCHKGNGSTHSARWQAIGQDSMLAASVKHEFSLVMMTGTTPIIMLPHLLLNILLR